MTSADLPDEVVEYGVRCGSPDHGEYGEVFATGSAVDSLREYAGRADLCFELVARRIGPWLPVDTTDTGQVDRA